MQEYETYLSQNGLFWDEFRKGETLSKGFKELEENARHLKDEIKIIYLFEEYGTLAIQDKELFVKNFGGGEALEGLSDNLIRCFCIYFQLGNEKIKVTMDWDHLKEYVTSELDQEEKNDLIPGFNLKKIFNPEETTEFLQKKVLKKLQNRAEELERVLGLSDKKIIAGIIRDCKQTENPGKIVQ